MCLGGLPILAWNTTESLSRPGMRQVDSNWEYCSIQRGFPPRFSAGNVSLQKTQPPSVNQGVPKNRGNTQVPKTIKLDLLLSTFLVLVPFETF